MRVRKSYEERILDVSPFLKQKRNEDFMQHGKRVADELRPIFAPVYELLEEVRWTLEMAQGGRNLGTDDWARLRKAYEAAKIGGLGR